MTGPSNRYQPVPPFARILKADGNPVVLEECHAMVVERVIREFAENFGTELIDELLNGLPRLWATKFVT